MAKRLNILLLIPNLDFGGAQRAFFYLGNHLSEKHQVYDCVFNTETGIAYEGKNELIELGVPGGKNFIDKILKLWQRGKALKAIKKKYSIDICISMLEGADYVNIISRDKDKVILCIQGSKMHDQHIKYKVLSKKLLIPWLYNKSQTIVTVSRGIKSELKDFLGVKAPIKVIENPCDTALVNEKMHEPLDPFFTDLKEKYTLVCTSGRLHDQKNQLELLKIFAQLKKEDQNIKLVIIGDGELRSEMVAKSSALKLSAYFAWEETTLDETFDVFFIGFQDNPFKYMYMADLFVLPSLWEGYPLALVEAMACGLPVMAANCPTGPVEILSTTRSIETPCHKAENEEFGILMPMPNSAKTIDTWAQAIKETLSDKNLLDLYSKKSVVRAEMLAVKNIYSKWTELIEN